MISVRDVIRGYYCFELWDADERSQKISGELIARTEWRRTLKHAKADVVSLFESVKVSR
jgi:hypothetical protein